MNAISRRQKPLLGTLVLMSAMIAPLHSDEPRKQPLGRYAELWSKSPFTVPPVVIKDETPEESPLDDYTLAGFGELKEGWFVILINTKERDKRVHITPGAENKEGFEVVKVQNGEGRLGAKVEIRTRGGKTGWVGYDEKFLALKKAAPKAPPGNPAANQPPIPQRPGAPGAAPNVRPPVPANRGGNDNNRGNRVRRVPTPPTR